MQTTTSAARWLQESSTRTLYLSLLVISIPLGLLFVWFLSLLELLFGGWSWTGPHLRQLISVVLTYLAAFLLHLQNQISVKE